MFDIEYRNILARTLGIAVTKRPNIPTPKRRGEWVEVAGRDGSLYVSDGTYDDITIPVEMNFIRSEKWYAEAYRTAKAWLQGSGKLRMSDNPDWHYRVKLAGITSKERVAKIAGRFDAAFICAPFEYKDGGEEFLELEEVLVNPYHEAEPIYLITGSGEKTLTVNGTEVVATVSGELIINTEKMLLYKSDGTPQNNAIPQGTDLKDFLLKPGLNEITISSGALKIAPNWRSL